MAHGRRSQDFPWADTHRTCVIFGRDRSVPVIPVQWDARPAAVRNAARDAISTNHKNYKWSVASCGQLSQVELAPS